MQTVSCSIATQQMRPDEAISKIVEAQNLIYGAFNDLFPNITNLDAHSRKDALIKCVLQMEEAYKEISVFEISRFLEEEETITLMAIIAIWGCATTKCLPFNEDDVETIKRAMSSTINGMGHLEEPRAIYQIALRILEHGISFGLFPNTARKLLPEIYNDTIEDSE